MPCVKSKREFASQMIRFAFQLGLMLIIISEEVTTYTVEVIADTNNLLCQAHRQGSLLNPACCNLKAEESEIPKPGSKEEQ